MWVNVDVKVADSVMKNNYFFFYRNETQKDDFTF